MSATLAVKKEEPKTNLTKQRVAPNNKGKKYKKHASEDEQYASAPKSNDVTKEIMAMYKKAETTRSTTGTPVVLATRGTESDPTTGLLTKTNILWDYTPGLEGFPEFADLKKALADIMSD